MMHMFGLYIHIIGYYTAFIFLVIKLVYSLMIRLWGWQKSDRIDGIYSECHEDDHDRLLRPMY